MIRMVAAHLSSAIGARLACKATGNDEWFKRHSERIEHIERELLPHGAGIDSGTKVDLDASTQDKLVLRTSFHHMNEHGSCDGWTEHVIRVTPTFGGVDVKVSGSNRNQIKDYLGDVFLEAMIREVNL